MVLLTIKLVYFLGAFLSFFGWGLLLHTLLRVKYDNLPFYTTATGISIVIFWGGILNLAGSALPFSLYLLLFIGLVSGLVHLVFFFKDKLKTTSNNRLSLVSAIRNRINNPVITDLFYLIIGMLLLFLLDSLLPASSFNYHDDLLKYIPRSVRMLQVGTLGNNLFSAQGIDSLGAQDFMNGFVYNIAGIRYLYGFDSIFCFILAALLMFDVCRLYKIRPAFTIIPVSSILLIPPQTVNISSTLSGTVMLTALMIAFTKISLTLSDSKFPRLFNIIQSALFFSSLVCLKVTFIPFLAFYLSLFLALTIIKQEDKRHILKVSVLFCLLLGCFVLPWAGIHFDNYATALSKSFALSPHVTDTGTFLFGHSNAEKMQNIVKLFSSKKLFFGGTGRAYTFCILVMGLAAILMLTYKKVKDPLGILFIPVIAASIACFTLYFIYPFEFPSVLGLRYIVPIILAVFPVSMAGLLKAYDTIYSSQCDLANLKADKNLIFFILMFLYLTFASMFIADLCNRFDKIYSHHTMLSFHLAKKEEYKNYFKSVFSKTTRSYYDGLQSKTPSNTTILALIAMPCYLNYNRNTVYSVGDSSGLVAPWLALPLTNIEELKAFFLSKKIRYILWEYNSVKGLRNHVDYNRLLMSSYIGRRKLGYYGLNMLNALEQIVKRSKLIYFDRRTCLVDITQ